MEINLIDSLKEKSEFYLDPWPHVIVNQVFSSKIADSLGKSWPKIGEESKNGKRLNLTMESAPNEIWKSFYNSIINEQNEDLNHFMCETFKGFCKPYEVEPTFDDIVLRYNEEREERMIKDWHIDGDRKKFTGLMYFNNPIGRLELTNCETTKVIEPKHNMYVFWAHSEEAVHRFFAGPGTRHSLSLSAHYPKVDL